MAGGKAVAVNKDKMIATCSADRIVEDDILAPPPVFMPEMNEGVRGNAAGFTDNVPDRRSGAVIGHNNLKIGEGLA